MLFGRMRYACESGVGLARDPLRPWGLWQPASTPSIGYLSPSPSLFQGSSATRITRDVGVIDGIRVCGCCRVARPPGGRHPRPASAPPASLVAHTNTQKHLSHGTHPTGQLRREKEDQGQCRVLADAPRGLRRRERTYRCPHRAQSEEADANCAGAVSRERLPQQSDSTTHTRALSLFSLSLSLSLLHPPHAPPHSSAPPSSSTSSSAWS